jgi:hypothetical protein
MRPVLCTQFHIPRFIPGIELCYPTLYSLLLYFSVAVLLDCSTATALYCCATLSLYPSCHEN